jgi:hypothetical protein
MVAVAVTSQLSEQPLWLQLCIEEVATSIVIVAVDIFVVHHPLMHLVD